MVVVGNGQQILVHAIKTDFYEAQLIEPIDRIELGSNMSSLKLLKMGEELYLTALLKYDRILKDIK
jgi:hypothetical protein